MKHLLLKILPRKTPRLYLNMQKGDGWCNRKKEVKTKLPLSKCLESVTVFFPFSSFPWIRHVLTHSLPLSYNWSGQTPSLFSVFVPPLLPNWSLSLKETTFYSEFVPLHSWTFSSLVHLFSRFMLAKAETSYFPTPEPRHFRSPSQCSLVFLPTVSYLLVIRT